MVSCVDQVLGMTINGDEGDDITFAESGIPNPYLQVISIFSSIHFSTLIPIYLWIYLSIPSSIHLTNDPSIIHFIRKTDYQIQSLISLTNTLFSDILFTVQSLIRYNVVTSIRQRY